MMAEQRLLAVSPNLPCAMDRQEWSLEDYHICKTLYNGYAAQVYTATCRYSGMEVVLKVYHDVDKAPDVAQHEMYREVAIQSGLQHPNVVHLFGAFEEGDTLVLVQEYVPNGDLLALMQSHGGRVDEATVVKVVLRPLLGALMYLHRWGIVHRDVKPENVLFAADGTIKLADFGLAINMVEERPISRVGTLDYMAPEVLRCPIKQSMAMTPAPGAPARYGFATDVWAVGIVTFELLTGLPPYASDCRYQAESRICSALPPIFPHAISPMARDFILRALAPIPGDRPTVRQLLEHPWMVNPDACVPQTRPHTHPYPYPQPQPHRSAQPVSLPQPPAAATSSAVSLSAPVVVPPTQHHHHHAFPGGYSSDPQQHASASRATAAAPVATPAAPLSAASTTMVSSPTATVPAMHGLSVQVSAATAAAVAAAALSTQQGPQHPSIDQQLRALQQQQLLDLSKLPLDQIQGMIQKLQEAMQLAVVQQQQQLEHQQPTLAAAARESVANDNAENAIILPVPAAHSSCIAAAAAPAAASSHWPLRCSPAEDTAAAAANAATSAAAGRVGDDSHMDDVQSEGACAVVGCCASAASASAAGVPLSAHSCTNSPQLALAQPAYAAQVAVVVTNAVQLPASVCGSQAALPPVDSASYAPMATGYGSLCASRRTTADATPRAAVTAHAMMPADSPTRVSCVRQTHAPCSGLEMAAAVASPQLSAPPPLPRATEGGVSPACSSPVQVAVTSRPRPTCSGGEASGAGSHGGALHEGDGLVYVSIGSSRKAVVGALCNSQESYLTSGGAAWMRQFAAP